MVTIQQILAALYLCGAIYWTNRLSKIDAVLEPKDFKMVMNLMKWMTFMAIALILAVV